MSIESEKEPYQPTDEEMKKAEETMTDEQKEKSEERKETYIRGYKEGSAADKKLDDWKRTQEARSADARRRGDRRA